MLKQYFPPAIPSELLASEDPSDKELVRIGHLANHLYSNFDVESRTYEKYRLLTCVLRKIDPSYFNKPISARESTTQLLGPNMAEQVKQLYKFIGNSSLRGILRAHVCGDAVAFLKEVCQAPAHELDQLKEFFDYKAFWIEFWESD